MNDVATLALVRKLAAARAVRIGEGDVVHFIAGSSIEDVCAALESATACVPYHVAAEWLVSGGVDLQGEAMRLVVRVTNEVLVVSFQSE